jgi:hypothetical protein
MKIQVADMLKAITLNKIVFALLLILSVGIVVSATIFISTYRSEHLGELDLCLQNDCVLFFLGKIDQSIVVLNKTFNFLFFLIASGGITIALAHYLSDSKSNSLTNHLSNFSVFNDYLKHEIEKSGSISEASVNIFGLYNLIYANSRQGDMSISAEYRKRISKLNSSIKKSNEKHTDPKDGSFHVLKHQDQMLPMFESLFFHVTRIGKSEYFEVESSILNLIQLVNKSFCNSENLDKIESPKYI